MRIQFISVREGSVECNQLPRWYPLLAIFFWTPAVVVVVKEDHACMPKVPTNK